MKTELGMEVKPAAPEIDPDDVANLLRVLRSAESWLTAEQVAAAMFGAVTDSLKRRVRAIASAARPSVVSFPGSRGYNLWERCTVEEIDHGIASLESQGKDMIKQANVYRMAYHRRYRGAQAAAPDQQEVFAL